MCAFVIRLRQNANSSRSPAHSVLYSRTGLGQPSRPHGLSQGRPVPVRGVGVGVGEQLAHVLLDASGDGQFDIGLEHLTQPGPLSVVSRSPAASSSSRQRHG